MGKCPAVKVYAFPCCGVFILSYSELECPDPISPRNGYIEVSNFKGHYQFGSVATYKCNPGFILWGNSTRYIGSIRSHSLDFLLSSVESALQMVPGQMVLLLVIQFHVEILLQ